MPTWVTKNARLCIIGDAAVSTIFGIIVVFQSYIFKSTLSCRLLPINLEGTSLRLDLRLSTSVQGASQSMEDGVTIVSALYRSHLNFEIDIVGIRPSV